MSNGEDQNETICILMLEIFAHRSKTRSFDESFQLRENHGIAHNRRQRREHDEEDVRRALKVERVCRTNMRYGVKTRVLCGKESARIMHGKAEG